MCLAAPTINNYLRITGTVFYFLLLNIVIRGLLVMLGICEIVSTTSNLLILCNFHLLYRQLTFKTLKTHFPHEWVFCFKIDMS